MSKHGSRPGLAAADEVEAHLREFLEGLAKAGYSAETRYHKQCLIRPFTRWVLARGIAVVDIDEACVEAFRACRSRRRCGQRTALPQFVDYLRKVEAVPKRRCEPSPAELLLQRYLAYLRDKQGLSPHSVSAYLPFVRAFVCAQRLPKNAAAVNALAVRRHLLDHARDRSASFVKLLAAALRSFLRFCFLDGLSAADLSTAVPPVRRWQLAGVPPLLTGEEVERVIEAADRSTPRGRRAFAILLLLVRLGLRASEIIALELDDIHWRTGEIVVRGKGRFYDRLPLLADVGEALAAYLRKARGSSKSRRVFLRHIAPRVGLSQPTVVSKIAREALRRADLLPTGRVGAHIFRHSLATRMIRRGASLAEISQALRHRSTTTTQLYTKVDFEGLRGVALPWPSKEVSR
jgi:integrase/recombinase XerD